jgi:YD repeat-containing protein
MKATLWLIPLALMAMAPTAVETQQFDAVGRLTDIAYATGGSIHYTYDANGNLLTIVSTAGTTGVGGKPLPAAFALGPVTPNPGAGPRRIEFAIPSRSRVTLRVIDVAGREVAKLLDRYLEPGPYTAQFSTASWGAGEYFYRLDAAGRRRTGRMTVLR